MRLGVEAAVVDGAIVPGDVAIHDGVVEAVGLSSNGARLRGLAIPGLVDLQVNGFGGTDFMVADLDGYRAAAEALAATGTTAFLPTFITAPEEDMVAALEAMPREDLGVRILGAHLEGPYLSPERMGAHPPEARRDPDLALLRRLLAAGDVRLVTLAPELPGALELVDELRARGIVVAAGHTQATAREAHAAFDRGVTLVTHLFNAMRSVAHRDPGIAYAGLTRPDVAYTLIADGHHLADETVLLASHMPGQRWVLITDAMAIAGTSGDGDFTLGGRPVTVHDGVVRGADGQLAGSALTMIESVRNVHALGVELPLAVAAASRVPAEVIGRSDLGRLSPGSVADVVVLDDRMEVQHTLVGGRSLVLR